MRNCHRFGPKPPALLAIPIAVVGTDIAAASGSPCACPSGACGERHCRSPKGPVTPVSRACTRTIRPFGPLRSATSYAMLGAVQRTEAPDPARGNRTLYRTVMSVPLRRGTPLDQALGRSPRTNSRWSSFWTRSRPFGPNDAALRASDLRASPPSRCAAANTCRMTPAIRRYRTTSGPFRGMSVWQVSGPSATFPIGVVPAVPHERRAFRD